MFYFKINDQIRDYIKKCPEAHYGCKYYCKQQLIAFDELELLRKELSKKNVVFTNDEFKGILQSTRSQYFISTHNCIAPENEIKRKDSSSQDESKDGLLKDKVYKKTPNPFFDEETFEKRSRMNAKRQEEDNRFNKKDNHNASSAYATASSGISMILSFFLIVIGSYYLGKSLIGLSDANTYILVLVVTIVVFISETCLIMLKLHKEQMANPQLKNIQKNSFAYRFNEKYRTHIEHPKTNIGVDKTKVE